MIQVRLLSKSPSPYLTFLDALPIHVRNIPSVEHQGLDLIWTRSIRLNQAQRIPIWRMAE